MMHEDKMGYCNLDGTLKLQKRKRQPTDEPRPSKVRCRTAMGQMGSALLHHAVCTWHDGGGAEKPATCLHIR